MKKTIITTILAVMTALSAFAQNAIDVHTHIILQEYKALLEKHGAALEETFPLPAWSAEKHVAFMDSAGISCAVLTMPAPQPYFGDSKECSELIRKINETSAQLKSEHEGRFLFCAALPLPDVDAAIKEAVYALDSLGADGVKLATNSRGQYLGDPELDPLMQVLNDRHAVVIIHPHRPDPFNQGIIETTPLAMYEYPAETTRAIVNMLSRNVLTRYPNIKVVVPHCGSFLPLAIPRMQGIMKAMVANGYMEQIDWEGNLSKLYYDLAGSPTKGVISSLLTITTPDHILYGSDYPYQPAQVLEANLQKLTSMLSSDKDLSAYKDMFLYGNAAKLFNTTQNKQETMQENNKNAETASTDGMLVRISEIEVYPEYLEEYLNFARNVGAESVRKEPGVIAIYPMVQQRDSCQIRILEIYADMNAYKHHITTDHFQTYKQGTLHMVKSLDLVDMHPLDPAAMPKIFLKMQNRQ